MNLAHTTPLNAAHPPERPRPARTELSDNYDGDHAIEAGFTRLRITDDAGETVGIIWARNDDDAYLRSLVPDGYKAMIRRGRPVVESTPATAANVKGGASATVAGATP